MDGPAEQIGEVVRELLADAESRTSLRGGRSHAGHDGDFFLQDVAGDFKLEISGQLQWRFLVNSQRGERGDRFRGGSEAS